jgi:hypothetical protein
MIMRSGGSAGSPYAAQHRVIPLAVTDLVPPALRSWRVDPTGPPSLCTRREVPAGVRLALSGLSEEVAEVLRQQDRDEAKRRLAAEYSLADLDALVDEVYAKAGA